MEVEEVPLELIRTNGNPRGEETNVPEMAQNLGVNGQLVPGIGHREGDMVVLVDGHRRLAGAKLNNWPTMKMIVLATKPTRVQVLKLQASLEAQVEKFKMSARCRLFADLQKAANETAAEISRQVGFTPSMVTKLVAVGNGDPILLEMLDQGSICLERAYGVVTTDSDHAKQRELAPIAGAMKRDQFLAKIKNKGKPDVKASSVRLALPGQMQITVRGPEYDIPTLHEVLVEAAKQVKKAMGAGHDCRSVARYLSNSVKGGQS